ncbi:hypothetical protein HKX48_001252 [Thoreauomyces humboldtii]|nr:hypothetical protein HKX48_001252 [Thoreauomyces humboldtii]
MLPGLLVCYAFSAHYELCPGRIWIALSSSVILSNKYILHTVGFEFPIFLTTCHLSFATVATQVLAKTTSQLAGLEKVGMNPKLYLRAVVPIGMFFSASLILSNIAYVYLTVAFIQMLKAFSPVAILLVGSLLGMERPTVATLRILSIVVAGVILSSIGEIHFVLVGVIVQALGMLTEAARLLMVQTLLSKHKMDPLCALYYFAPVCALMNGAAFLVFESPRFSSHAFHTAGAPLLLVNAAIAFALNVAVVVLIKKSSSLVLCLAGIFKDVLLVVVSTIVFATDLTLLQVVGYAITLCGLYMYKRQGTSGSKSPSVASLAVRSHSSSTKGNEMKTESASERP